MSRQFGVQVVMPLMLFVSFSVGIFPVVLCVCVSFHSPVLSPIQVPVCSANLMSILFNLPEQSFRAPIERGARNGQLAK